MLKWPRSAAWTTLPRAKSKGNRFEEENLYHKAREAHEGWRKDCSFFVLFESFALSCRLSVAFGSKVVEKNSFFWTDCSGLGEGISLFVCMCGFIRLTESGKYV